MIFIKCQCPEYMVIMGSVIQRNVAVATKKERSQNEMAQSATLDTASTRYLGVDPIGKLLVKFTIPCVVAMLVNSLYNIVDQIFIGHGVGYLGNAATNAVFPITVVAAAFALLIGDGAAASYSLKLGAGEFGKAKKTITAALALGLAVGALFTVLGLVFLEPLLAFFGATEAIMPYGIEYGGMIVLGLVFFVVSVAVNPLIRASGAPRYAMLSMVSGAVINTVLDYLFIFPLDMGVGGAALATVIAQFVVMALNVGYLLAPGHLRPERNDLRIDGATVRGILACGASSFITQIAITVVISIVNKSLILYGAESEYGAEIPFAALGVVMKVNQIMFSIILGIAVGAQPIIGYNYGAGNLDRVRRTFVLAATVATSLACLSFVAFVFFPQYLVAAFGSEQELYNRFAVKCFQTYLFFSFLNGFQVVTGVFFQAMGRAGLASVISISRQIGFFGPAALILPLYLGIEGLLYSGPVADVASFILALLLAVRELRRLDDTKAGSVSDRGSLDPAPALAVVSTSGSVRLQK